MAVIPFDPIRRTVNAEPPHIDDVSRTLLLVAMSELVAVRDGEPDPQRAERLRPITCALGAVLARFEPPKGAA